MYDIQQVCRVALDMKASDIHITADSPPVFRIGGELRIAKIAPLSAEDIRKAVYGFLHPDQIRDFEQHQGLDFTFFVDGEHRFRANVYLQRSLISIAFRPIASDIPTIDQLGLPALLKEIAMTNSGLVLVTGPTGHGKSSTQAALINHVNNNRRAHVITIEDPIEYIFKNNMSIIEQREIGSDVPSFHQALRMILRQDPDVIMVGEMRDLDTIEATLRAAETGHLVFANLHANDAAGSLERLLNVFPGIQQGPVRVTLSMTLIAILAQRLLPGIDGKTRVPAVEILTATDAVRHLIRDGKVHQIHTVMQTGSRDNMITMDSAVAALHRQGKISYDVAKNMVKSQDVLSP